MDCPVLSGRESSRAWRFKQVPMYDPQRNCPWAVNEPGDRIPVKIFGDDCVYDERLSKAYALVLSLPL